ncbi:MAG: radical SAM protein [Alphaproteobacteria bacterium]|nr:radical SAM protein [Alphaproteobacteria bacterium]
MAALRVYLGDLTHDTIGLATEVFPLNIGLVGAYAIKRFGDDIEVRLFKYIHDLEQAIADAPPDVLGLSNYPWCHNVGLALFEQLAERNPDALRIMGGPNFPHDTESQIRFLRERPILDAYVYLDGEYGFANIVEMRLGEDSGAAARKRMRSEPVEGCAQWDGADGLVAPPMAIRPRDLEEIPSPYLTGLLDPFFDGRLAPMISTNRGCPFQCTFCHDGTKLVSKVNNFGLERVIEEIRYIGERVPSSVHSLFVSDLNFGMLKRDVEICDVLAESQAKYGYPRYIDATTGKNAKRRVIAAIEKLNGSLRLSLSVQSLTENVLTNIKRDNIRLDDFLDLQPTIKQAHLPTNSEVILGLPGETLDSHFKVLGDLLDTNVDSVVPYTLMLVNGSELASPAQRKMWDIRTKWRIIPRDFTKLLSGRNVIEVEEVGIETSTLSFEDYVEARKMALLIRWVNNHGFRALIRLMIEENIGVMSLLRRMLDALNDESLRGSDAAPTALAELFADFGRDTVGELWDSEEEIVAHYADDENFQRLVDGEDGKNLSQSYEAAAIAGAMPELTTCIFHHAAELFAQTAADSTSRDKFDDVRRFCTARGHNLFGGDRLETVPEEAFSYDIAAWLNDPETGNLDDFAFDAPTRIRFELTPTQYREVENALDIFGHSPAGQAKTLIRVSAGALYRNAASA